MIRWVSGCSLDKNTLSSFVWLSTKPTLTPTNPSSVFPRQQLYHGQSSHLYQCDSCAIVISFHQLRETVVSKVTVDSHVLGRKNISQHEKNIYKIFLHTSVVPSSPGWHRQEMGMTASCLGRLWWQTMRNDVMAEQCSCAFSRLFVMRDLQLPPRCFICDLVFPGQMAIGCLTCPLCSSSTVCGKKKKQKYLKAFGHKQDFAQLNWTLESELKTIYIVWLAVGRGFDPQPQQNGDSWYHTSVKT